VRPQESTEIQDNTISEKKPARKHPQENARKHQENARKHEEEYKIVLDFIKEYGKVTRKEIISLLNCKDTKAKMILKEMTETYLTKITKGIYTYYILKLFKVSATK